MGKIRGPRIWATGQALGARVGSIETEGSRAWRGYMKVPNAEAARAIVQQEEGEGYDALKLSEFLHARSGRGRRPTRRTSSAWASPRHSWDAIASANAGVDGIEHIWSVGYTSIMDLDKRHQLAVDRTAGRIDAEVAGALYQVENYDKVIAPMVAHHVAWTPTIAKWLRPLSPSAQRFWQREQEILGDPNANFPAARACHHRIHHREAVQALQARAARARPRSAIRRPTNSSAVSSRPAASSRKARIRRAAWPGLLMHEALVMDVEAGVPPMTAIQAATLNVAKTFHKDKDYGSVEPGKVADLSIIEGDPLKDIWMTQNVKMVVMNGKIVDHQFTRLRQPDSGVQFLAAIVGAHRGRRRSRSRRVPDRR